MPNAPLTPLEKALSEGSKALPAYDFNKVERQEPIQQPDQRAPTGGGSVPSDLLPLFEQSATEYGVPVNILLGLAEQESSFNTKALGQPTEYGRAKGIMQYIDTTAANMGINPYDPAQSIGAAAKQLRERLDKGYSMEDAVKEHFAGPNRAQWGPKTAQYGIDVLERAARFGGNYQPGEPVGTGPAMAAPSPLTIDNQEAYKRKLAEDMLADLNKDEPGRFSVPTPEQMGLASNPEPIAPIADTSEKDGFFSATGKAVGNIPENFENAAGGLMRYFGEDMGAAKEKSLQRTAEQLGIGIDDAKLIYWAESNKLIDEELKKSATTQELVEVLRQRHTDTPEKTAATTQAAQQAFSDGGLFSPEALAAYGKGVSQAAKDDMAEIDPDGPLAKYGSMIIGSTAEMVPALVAGMVTRNPNVTLGMIGGQVYGQSYDRAREDPDNPLEPRQAAQYALAQAAAEAIPSALPIGIILSRGGNVFSGLLKAGAAEAAQEGLTAALQSAIDKGTITPDMTWGEAVEQIRDGMIVGAGAGVGMKAGVDLANKGVDAARGGKEGQLAREMERAVDDAQFDVPADEVARRSFDPSQAAQIERDRVASTGPLGRALSQTIPVNPVVNEEPEPEAPVMEAPAVEAPVEAPAEAPVASGQRVTISAEGIDPITGEIVSQSEAGIVVKGDDGSSYELPATDIQSGDVVITPEAAAEPVAEAVAEEPKPEPKEIERPASGDYTTMAEPDLRKRLKYLVQQGKATGWNKMLLAERKKVESAIDALKAPEVSETVTPVGETVTNAPETVTEEPVKWFGSQEKADAHIAKKKLGDTHEVVAEGRRFEIRPKAQEKAEQAETEQAPVMRSDGSPFASYEKAELAAKNRRLKGYKPQQVEGGWALTNRAQSVADTQTTAEGSQQPVTRAQAITQAEGAAAAVISQGGTDAEASRAATDLLIDRMEDDPSISVAVDAPKAVEAAKAGNKPNRTKKERAEQVVGKVGQTVVPDRDFDYLTGGKPMVVESISKDGKVYLRDPVAGSGTEINAAMAERLGIKFEATAEAEAPADPWRASMDQALQKVPAEHPMRRKWEAQAKNGLKSEGDRDSALKQAREAGESAQTPASKFPPMDIKIGDSVIKDGDTYTVDGAIKGGISATRTVSADGVTNERTVLLKGDEALQARMDAVEAEKRNQSETPDSNAKPAVSKNTIFTENAAEAARKLLRSKLGQLNTGIDPEIMQAGITLAGYHIEKGARSFAAYAKAMTADLGDLVRPYLKSWYMGVKFDPRAAEFDGMSTSAEVETFDLATLEEARNEPEQLDQPGQGALEGTPTAEVRPTEGAAPTGQRTEGGGRADARGNDRAGSQRNDDARSLGSDTGAVPVPASRERGRSAEPQQPVQRGDAGSAAGRADGRRDNDLKPTAGATAQQRASNYSLSDADAIGQGGAKTKFKTNISAIRLLKGLEAEGRQATAEEQAALAKYVGWGGIPQAFERSDNTASKGWEKEVAELKELLTPEEYSAAASSTKNAHYTSPEIVKAMWEAVGRLGFKGGRVLEPSVGAGNFFGLMPAGLRKASALNGVELDRITSGIAAQLYPQAKIARMGYQDYLIPDGYFDVAIGNPPFGRESLYDGKRKDLSGFSIHNYFFAKSLDGLKPGGVLAMVVTNRMLDVPGDKARQYMAGRADFLGAIRLPNDAFMANAGTAVTTDIIFMRKRAEGEPQSGETWMDVKEYTDKDGGKAPLNEYFHRHPEMMLGDFGAYGSMYREGEPALIARKGQDTAAELARAMALLPENVMAAVAVKPESAATVRAENVRVGSMFIDGGTVKVRGEDVLGENTAEEVVFPNDKAKDRVVGMIGMRNDLARLRALQLNPNAKTKEIEAARKTLNKGYDAFVKANGPINLDTNKRLFRDDPTWPQLSALEDGFDKGISTTTAKKTGEEARKPSAKKAAIFSKRTQSPYQAPESASSAKDALVSSLAETGRVDLAMMSSLYGKPEAAIVKELGGLIFNDPAKGYVTRDEYLSGNVKAKLAKAREAAATDATFAPNVEALEAVQPADIEAIDINVKPGAAWLPQPVMTEFANLMAEGSTGKFIFNPISAKWSLVGLDASSSAQQRFGTGRVDVKGILEAAANQKTIQVYDSHQDGSRTLNETETQLANDKVNAVKEEWSRWVWADDARRESLARLYNDMFNTDVAREYDGSHLTLPGKVGDDIVKLRPHQNNGVWRIIQSDTTLTDHVVGAGKTFTLIAGAMELRRMGLAKKPLFAVPNHLVGQWAADFVKLYPGANILAATKKDFEKNNRKRLFARIATGDWDAVIVAHSSFGKVDVEPKEEAAFIEEQVADLDASIEVMRQTDGKDSRNVKETTKRRDALREKIKKLLDTDNKDDSLYWGELGIDALFLDEAHEFKNLAFSSSMNRVAGLGNQQGSQKASDMFLKVRQVLNTTGGRNVVFATGTPISNTMAEMYTMQRYLDYPTMKAQGLTHFDAWARMFGEVVTDWELSPSGKYKMNSRFAKFVNMPELMQRYTSFADVINRDDINRMLASQGKKLPVPKIKGGKPENVVVQRSQDQANYIGEPIKDADGNETDEYPQGSLVYRSENLPKKAEKGGDNMLKVMGDARKAALDMRLIDPSYPDNPRSKVNVAAGKIKSIYDRWSSERGAQLVFIDLSTPKNAKAGEAARLRDLVARAEQGDEAAASELDKVSPDELMALEGDFSVYDDLKQKLIAKGIPEAEVAFIHDAKTELQKEDLYGKVRSGRIRVMLGSTAKMGAGMNVQDRLVALHHLDAPWRPSDLEQREGRIIRQGNKLYDADPEGFEVEIVRYATKQTLDSRMWQTIEGKATFIEQVRKGNGAREIEDVAGEAANAAEMKAASSGNPLILEEMSLRQTVRKLENERMGHDREQHRLASSLSWARSRISSGKTELAELQSDMKLKVPQDFAMTVMGETFDKRKDAGEALLAKAAEMEEAKAEVAEIGRYGDFNMTMERLASERFSVTLEGSGDYSARIEIGNDPVGTAMRVTNTVKDLAGEAEKVEQTIRRAESEIPKLEAQIASWPKDDALAAARERHSETLDKLKPKKKEAPEQPKASVSDDGNLKSTDELNKVLRASDMGDVIGKMLDTGRLVLHDQSETIPQSLGKVSGQYVDGRMHLVASRLTKDNAVPVLLHEMFHSGVRPLVGEKQWGTLLGRLSVMRKQAAKSEGKTGEIHRAAEARVQAAERSGIEMNDRVRAEEFGAYLIENYERMPRAFKSWVDDVMGAVKAFLLRRFGIQAGQITPAQLRSLSVSALKSEAPSARGVKGSFDSPNTDIPFRFNPDLPRGTVGKPGPREAALLEQIRKANESTMDAMWSEVAEIQDGLAAEMEQRARENDIDFGLGSDMRAAMEPMLRHQAYQRWLVSPKSEGYQAVQAEQRALQNEYDSLVAQRVGPPEFESIRQQRDLPRAVTGTSAFRKWFDGSQVVDADGLPLIVLHGSNKDLTEFNTNRVDGSGAVSGNWLGQLGSWFAAEPKDREAYEDGTAESVADTFAKYRGDDDATIYPVYLSVKNAAEYAGYDDLLMAYDDAGSAAKLRGQLEADGHDGIVVRDSMTDGDGVRDDWVAFQPSQIKSAIGNNGNFDPTNPDIRASVADNAPTEKEIDGWFSRKLTDAMAGPKSKGQYSILALAPMDRMIDEMTDGNAGAREYLKLKRDMDAYRTRKHTQFDETAQKWLKMNALNRQAGKDLAGIMHDATIAQADPAERFVPSVTEVDRLVMGKDSEAGEAARAKQAADNRRREAYKDLKERFDKLPPKFQAQYREVRDTYKEMTDELDKILIDNLSAAIDIHGRKAERTYEKEMAEIRDEGLTGDEKTAAEDKVKRKFKTATTKLQWNKRARMTQLRQQFEANRLQGPYFPLARFGDYFVTVRDKQSGEVISFSRFESRKAQQLFARQVARMGDVQTGLLSNDNDVKGAVDPRFISDVEDILGGADVPDSVKDQVWQRYLESMPDMSMRKGFIHRKNREGFTNDALRAFASSMFHNAHQMGRLKYGAQMQESIELAGEHARTTDTPERDTAIINEVRRRHDYVMNPKGGALAQHLTSAAFVYQLSMSPAAALVNISQTVILGVPIVGAQFGNTKTIAALTRAMKDFTAGRGHAVNAKSLTDGERAAMKAAQESGLIESTQSHNLAGVGETGVEYSALRNKVMGVVAWMFHNAERFNREVTFLSTYRLARDSGMAHEQAIDEATNLTYKVHFDYGNTNRPRAMHGDTAKVALVFRNYQINMLYRLFRDMHQTFKGDTKEARREALKQLGGISGMLAMGAGVKGVWGYGIAMILASMFFGDDAEEEFTKGTVELLGPTLGGVLLNGLPGHATGISLSGRIGMPDLWFRSPYRQLEGQDQFNYWQSQLLGFMPVMASNMFRGWQLVEEGKPYRGIETAAPKFVKDLMRAARYANEGVTNLRGDTLVSELTPTEIGYQVMGFTPAVVAEQYERNSALINAESRIMDARRDLMDRYAMAHKQGDTTEMAEVRKDMQKFNKENREVPITPQTINQSLRARNRYSGRSEGGVTLNPKLDRRLRDNLGEPIYR